tara:strand:+ start:15483 stop:16685 length:1203 start_codon:yes stop_codon:yes gene_type:complete
MQYNLLNYGVNESTCSNFDITLANKDVQLEKIIRYINPDILAVNEMGCRNLFSKRILANCLNKGTTKYELTDLQVSGTQNLCNALFYNKEKLGLISSSAITKTKNGANIIRAIDFHKLYIKGDYLSLSDTIRLYQLVAHLRASRGNEAEREKAAEGVMYHLEKNETTGNYILSGDFNVYRSSEGAYQQFTKYSKQPYRFYDPVKQEGSWNNNSAYAKVHTQATRSNTQCGGMDDRFDFILTSNEVLNDSLRIRYIPNSYRAVGQDGKRFNGSVINPANTDVPSSIANNLYNMSDHLPVVLKLEVSYEVPTNIRSVRNNFQLSMVNPSSNGIQFTTNNSGESKKINFQVFSLDGRMVKEGNADIRAGFQQHMIELSDKGIFLLKITNAESQESSVHKVMVW